MAGQYQILDVASMSKYQPSQYYRDDSVPGPSKPVFLKPGVTPIPGTTKTLAAAATANAKNPNPGAPASFGAETSPAALTGSLPSNQAIASPLANLRLALQSALNEAGKKRLENNLKIVQPVAEGMKPGGFGSVVDLVRNGVQNSVEGTFKTIVTAQDQEAQQAQDQKSFALKTFSELSSSGALAKMPPEALMILEKQAGLPEGTSLAWKARLEAVQKQDDVKRQLEQKYINSQIDENYAQIQKMKADTAQANDLAPFIDMVYQDPSKITIVPSKMRGSVLKGVNEKVAIEKETNLNSYISDISKFTSRDQALNEIKVDKNKIINEVGQKGLDRIQQEIETKFPNTPQESWIDSIMNYLFK